MRRKTASDNALEKMRKADAEATWEGKFRCCGKTVKGTPADIASQIDEHLKRGCDGS